MTDSIELDSVLASANAYFDRLEPYIGHGQDLWMQVSGDDQRAAGGIEARAVQLGSTLLTSDHGPLIGDADRKDLRVCIRRMSAALRLRGYQHWDSQVIFDEDIYRGTQPAGQSEYLLDSVARARAEFASAAKEFSRIAMLAKPIGSSGEHDDLLPLLRRKNFDQDTERILEDSKASSEPVALLIVDVDHFKNVNDEHGHSVGDEALKSVAAVIKQAVAGKGRAYRYGGEEMAVLLRNATVDEAVALGERIRREVEKEARTSRAIYLTVSIGIATFPAHAADAGDLVDAADRAMYDAKNLGRNLTRVIGEVRDAVVRDRVIERAKPAEREGTTEPFKIPRLNEPELEHVMDHYRALGLEPALPKMEERDVKLAGGYTLAYYPGTEREVWVGFHDGFYEHLLMLKPPTGS